MATAHVIRVRIRGNDLGDALSAIHTGVTAMMARLGRQARSTWCTVNGGHYKVLHAEPTRLALKCVACGHETPGWEVGGLRLSSRPIPHQEPLRLVKTKRAA